MFSGAGEGARLATFFTENTHMGGIRQMKNFRIDVGIDHIKDYLKSRIDTSNPVEMEKVGRYLKHIEMYRRMEKTVRKEGVSVTTENGSQSFVKSHPLLNEMNRVNSSIMNIEKTFNFTDENKGPPKFSAEDMI